MQDVVTQDGNRVILLGQNNDYINATRIVPYQDYLDRSWIVTQGPMDGTIAGMIYLFWIMHPTPTSLDSWRWVHYPKENRKLIYFFL